MKIKKIISAVMTVSVLASCLFSTALTARAQESVVFSPEYKTSPFYTKLVAAQEDSKDKTTMEKVLAAALSQEGYQNYATSGIDIEKARADGLLWTGKEQRMNNNSTGNTEYTRWAQTYVMDLEGSAQYEDIDWCAIFVSWCMYQGGYYNEEKLKKYYYSYCAEPRVEFDADSWIAAFDLQQKNVYYTPGVHHKLDAYNWSTYYNIDVDPFELPYKPGGLVFFSWDGSGTYFDHVAIVVDYDKDTHVLTYTNGNSAGQVITRQIDLDEEEAFRGMAYTKNSNRVAAYADYDEIKPLAQKEITTESTKLTWDKESASGLRIQTNSESVIVSVSVDEKYLGDNIVSNMLLQEGKVSIGKSELKNIPVGDHKLLLTFDDGVLAIDLHISGEAKFGDANTDSAINMADATRIQKVLSGQNKFTDVQKTLADVDGDGKVTIADVTCIQKYIAEYKTGCGKTGETVQV